MGKGVLNLPEPWMNNKWKYLARSGQPVKFLIKLKLGKNILHTAFKNKKHFLSKFTKETRMTWKGMLWKQVSRKLYHRYYTRQACINNVQSVLPLTSNPSKSLSYSSSFLCSCFQICYKLCAAQSDYNN